MRGNTKSSKSDVLRSSDRQHVWLSLLLVITCVCLLVAVLTISFFIYREIDRGVRKPEDSKGGIHEKYRGDSEVTPSTPVPWTSKTIPAILTATTKTHTFIKTPYRKDPDHTYIRWPAITALETTVRAIETETSSDSPSTAETTHDIDDSIFFPADIPLADKESAKSSSSSLPRSLYRSMVPRCSTCGVGTHDIDDSVFFPADIPLADKESAKYKHINDTPPAVDPSLDHPVKSKPDISKDIKPFPTFATTEFVLLKENGTLASPTESDFVKHPASSKEESTSTPSTKTTTTGEASTRYRYFVKTVPEVTKKKTTFVKTGGIKSEKMPESIEKEVALPLAMTEVSTSTSTTISESTPTPTSTMSTKRYRYTVKTAPEIAKMKTYFVKTGDLKDKTILKSIDVDSSLLSVGDVASKSTPEATKSERSLLEKDDIPEIVPELAGTVSPMKDDPEPRTIIKYITKDPPPPIKVCETITCKRSVSRMIALMDHSEDPCEDFYSFVCRGIEVNHLRNPQYENLILTKLEDMSSVDANTKKFKQFVESCRAFNFSEGITRVNQLIFDIFHKSDEGDKRDTLTRTILKILSVGMSQFSFGLLPMFDFTVEADRNGSFVPTLTIPSIEHGQVDKECIKNLSISDPDEKNIHEIYEKFNKCSRDITSNAFNILHVLRTLPSDLPIIDDVDKMMSKLEKIPKTVNKREWHERMLTVHDDPVYFSIKDLHEKYPEINWAILLNTLFKEDAAKIEKVQVMFKDYLDKIFQWYRETLLGDLSLAFRIIFTYDIYNQIFMEYDKYNIQEYCMKKAITTMEDLATKLLLVNSNRKSLDLLNEVAGDIFRNLKTHFRMSIQNTSWLSKMHKNSILSTLDKLQLTADFNNLWFNDPLLSYRNGKVILTNNYVDNLILLKRNQRSIIYQKIDHNPGNVWIYKYNPLSTSVWTILEQNRIILPPGLLMKLAYKKRPQQYQIYALLGFQIARGIGAFFEPTELKRLLPGIEENEVYKNYLHIRLGDPQVAKTTNKYEIVASKEDLLLSKNSRFTDDLAVRLSMDTYNRTYFAKELQFLWLNYTVPQLFYATLAQDFCKPEDETTALAIQVYEDRRLPNYFRVNSLLMNTIGFSDAYHCPLGSTMNPAFKADAFPHITYTEIDYL